MTLPGGCVIIKENLQETEALYRICSHPACGAAAPAAKADTDIRRVEIRQLQENPVRWARICPIISSEIQRRIL